MMVSYISESSLLHINNDQEAMGSFPGTSFLLSFIITRAT